jgi:GNAT superfamily N-acetyltransferase
VIREIRPDDVAAVVGLVHELAAYEEAADQCLLTAEQLHAALFSGDAHLYGHVAEADGAVVGCALWFLNFSTWHGVHGIHLEDLYVQPSQRGSGLGTALLARLAQICVERGYRRLEWQVLDWNEPAIRFYRSIGAGPHDGWTSYRLTGDALTALGSPAGPSTRRATAR